MRPTDAGLREAARQVLAYLAECDPLPATRCDAIIGFGVFDLELPRFCGELFTQGRARHLVFTGGIGAGTGKLGGAEADAWREELRRSHPEIGDDMVILENASTNTAENIRFTATLLERTNPSLRFGEGIRTAIIVASPSRLRRVGLTMRRQQPGVQVFRHCPTADFEREQALYAHHGVEFVGHLRGELDRILDYGTRGWIAPEPLPPAIAAAHAVLKVAKR